MIARLIKQGSEFEQCDILILDHFYEAVDFCKKTKQTGTWHKVMYFDDGMLDDYKLKLNPVEKYHFYHSWKHFLPAMMEDISMYSEVFLAHDFVAVEYAIMRKFSSEGKKVTIFEEGYSNYINNSTHETLIMKGLKRISPWLGLPGGYFGSLKWVDSVWVQRPQLIIEDLNNPIRFKAKPLPMQLTEFLQLPEIIEEMYILFPEIAEIDAHIQGAEVISVVLTESWHDEIPDRDLYVNQIVSKVNEIVQNEDSLIFIKQHPGENLPMQWDSKQIVLLPKQLPFELLYLIMKKHRLKKVNLFSFGSTAILNLYHLCKEDGSLDIYLFGESMSRTHYMALKFPRFCELATKFHVQFKIV
ncbi:hypothetical protein EHS13_05315 [Paenibacillus psychroresistens]|uniref:Uncharacterized protein n=2 Tax=Paenibacillus psychroresistens TaxID=1778678 RepID=A0A6B8RG75_9BACL|nr:hypothetical protein [Paenibacillus psychroresistens]QGQ94366.1 hypothetical protein EHS13_05315 [Paenibacillus psychroresistens]